MTFAPGSSSRNNLKGVHGDLVRVIMRAYEITSLDFSVICGLRTQAQQDHAFATGASKTRDSAHLYGLAVDLQPYLLTQKSPYPQPNDSPELVRYKLGCFETIARFVFVAADEIGVLLQWGNDWDCDGIPTRRDRDEKGWLQDMVHFQLPPAHRIAAANNRAHERIALRAAGKDVIS